MMVRRGISAPPPVVILLHSSAGLQHFSCYFYMLAVKPVNPVQ